MTQTLETLYSQFTGHAPESVEALPVPTEATTA